MDTATPTNTAATATVSNTWISQAIITKYLGATDHRGSRVKATAAAGSVTVSWDHELNATENHSRAAMALANKLGWAGEWRMGGAPGGNGNVYVL